MEQQGACDLSNFHEKRRKLAPSQVHFIGNPANVRAHPRPLTDSAAAVGCSARLGGVRVSVIRSRLVLVNLAPTHDEHDVPEHRDIGQRIA